MPSALATLLTGLLLLLSLILLYTIHGSAPPPAAASGVVGVARAVGVGAGAKRRYLSLSAGANGTISADLRALTLRPHLAGTPSAAAAAKYVLSHFRQYGIETSTRDYTPLLSYPSTSSLSLHHPNLTLVKPISLAEPADPDGVAVRPYHAYSPSGEALAPAVYVNLGRDEDYEALDRMGVNVTGCIAVARRGGGYRGAVVERAAARGAVAVLVAGYLDGGVERGTVTLRAVGDPLTPGWAADGTGERLSAGDEEVRRRFPRIPSMPVSAAAAEEILETLGGPPVPAEWRGGPATGVGGVGGGPMLVNFIYKEDRKMATIRNVFGVIRGREEPDRYVILGNHRDAWTYGAVDPNSGTAALLDVARRYGVLLHSGWRPRRTIVLCSWDAEEFGMIGSTEWVEQNIINLGSKAVAYLNVDCAVQGSGFFAGATPQLDTLLVEITKQIEDPESGGTVYQEWAARNGSITIERLARADSDFTAFLHHAGIPSVDLYYGEVFSGYHTALDSFEWMQKSGDPLFHRHVAISEIWGLLGLHLADDPVLPFDYISYASQLKEHTNTLRTFLDGGESLQPINASINKLTVAANEAEGQANKLHDQTLDDFTQLRHQVFNDRLILAERGFLEVGDRQESRWFKHLIYSPPADYESRLSFFPGIADAISRAAKAPRREEAQLDIQHEIWRVARAIERAASMLRGELP